MILESKLVLWLSAIVIIYVVYRTLIAVNRKGSEYEKELELILNSEEYKVKGKYE